MLGRPTIGYDHGGVGEILADIYPAGRVAVGDTEAAANRLAQVSRAEVRPPERTNRFGHAAQAKFPETDTRLEILTECLAALVHHSTPRSTDAAARPELCQLPPDAATIR